MIFPHHLQTKIQTQSLKRSHTISSILLTALLIFASATALGQQESPAQRARLGKIEVAGLQRYSQDEIIAASELKIGQLVDVAALDAAANRLMNTGLFKNLSYRYRVTGDQATVTFQVEEVKKSAPVVFDNFVWFSDEEIMNAVRQ